MPTPSKRLPNNDQNDLVRAEQALKRAQEQLEPMVRGRDMLPSEMRNRAGGAFVDLGAALAFIGNIFRRPRQPNSNGNGNGEHSQ